MSNSDQSTTTSAPNDANKYRPFSQIEHDILASLRELIASTSEIDVSGTTTTQMAGALTLALSYINKATLASTESGTTASSSINADGTETSSADMPGALHSRILVISVSGDLAHQYIPIMNTTFAAQRLRIPIDILKLAGDTVFLQQASDATKGTYMQLRNPQGLLQYLMMAFLPDQAARKCLFSPSQEVVDFRAACFCHRNVVDVGFVCSICLSSTSSSVPFPLSSFPRYHFHLAISSFIDTRERGK
jgi:transcription initiation factor TFIIH subunit 3